MKSYEVGYHVCTLIETDDHKYKVKVKDDETGFAITFTFKTKLEALEEIISYAEI